MSATFRDPDPGEMSANERRALVRQLTNLCNQRASDRRQFNEHFNRYGTLLEGLFQRLDDQKTEIDELRSLMHRVYRLGVWWEHKELEDAWEPGANA